MTLESTFIGSVINNHSHDKARIERVKSEFFSSPSHKKIWEIIQSIASTPTILTVETEAKGRGVIPDHENIFHYIAIDPSSDIDWMEATIRDRHIRRDLYGRLSESLLQVQDTDHDLYDILVSLEGISEAGADASIRSAMTPEEIREEEASREPEQPLSHGHPILDKFYEAGQKKGQVEVVFGQTGHGKTSVVEMRVAMYLRRGHKVLWLQLEGDKVETLDNIEKCLGYDTSPTKNLLIYDGHIELSEILREITIVDQEFDIDLVVIDYLQEISAPQFKADIRQEKAYISKTLRRRMKDLKIFGLFVAQPSRLPRTAKGWDARPRLTDLAETSQIEKDAYTVTGVFRPNMMPDLVVGEKVKWIKEGEYGPYDSIIIEILKSRKSRRKSQYIHLIHTEKRGVKVYEGNLIETMPYKDENDDEPF